MIATAPDPYRSALIWILGAATVGLAVGASLPFLMERSLELYAIGLTCTIVTGVLAMPRSLRYDDSLCWWIFLGALSLFSIYPAYISLQISGLPWISPTRMMLAALLMLWLHALRTSPEMWRRLVGHVRANRLFFILLAVFNISQLLALPTSRDPGQALQKFLLFQLYWTFPLMVVLTLVRTEARLRMLGGLFITFALVQCLVGFLEARQERLLWLDYLPPGFGADSEVITRIIQGTFRAEGYRVQGSFTVSLVYAEFLVIMLPFALFAFIDGQTRLMRVFGLVTAILILPAQYLSGSRLGMVGAITVFLALIAFYVFRVWRADRRNMIGPFLLLLMPFGLMVFISAFAVSPRLRALTIGGGQHQASTDSRLEMWTGGFPKILERPLFGHGSGLGAETLGFTNLTGVLTIDTYWLSALLEFGVVGAGALLGMIVWVFVAGAKAYSAPAHGLSRLGGPIAVSLLTFFIVKSVLSQADNHLLVFVMMAMMLIVARGTAAFDETAEDLTTARPSGPTRGAQLRRPVVATQPSRVAATSQDGRGRRFPVDPPRPSRSLRTGTR